MVARFTGTAINCTGSAVTNGFVDISIDNSHYAGAIVNGNFSVVVSRCNITATTAAISAVDNTNSVQGTAVQVVVADTLVNTGPLTACGTFISEYLNYTLSGATKIFISPADTISFSKNQNGAFSIRFGRKNNQTPVDQVNLVFAASSSATTPLITFNISNNNSVYRLKSSGTINLTENGAIGGYITGNFTTDFTKDSSSTIYPVTANFRIKRIY